MDICYTFDMQRSTTAFPKAMLFDMDGVLLMTTQSPDQSWSSVCQRLAPSLSLAPETLLDAIRQSRRAYKHEIEFDPEKQQRDRLEPFATRREMVEKALHSVGQHEMNLASEMVHAYEALRDEHRQLVPHAIDTLQQLRKWELPLALISNGNASYQRRKIAQYQLAPFFDAIFIEEEFGIAKPDPRIFLAALEQLNMKAQETWMIGDNLALDIEGAQQVGIFALWFDPSKRGLPADSLYRPNYILHSLSELVTWDQNK